MDRATEGTGGMEVDVVRYNDTKKFLNGNRKQK